MDPDQMNDPATAVLGRYLVRPWKECSGHGDGWKWRLRLNPAGFCTRLDTVFAVGSVQKTVPGQPEILDCSFSELGSTQTSDHSLLWVALRSGD